MYLPAFQHEFHLQQYSWAPLYFLSVFAVSFTFEFSRFASTVETETIP